MMELNRTADVGVEWSEKGIENVANVFFHSRLNNNHFMTQKQVLIKSWYRSRVLACIKPRVPIKALWNSCGSQKGEISKRIPPNSP
jgi:hypothetical protein